MTTAKGVHATNRNIYLSAAWLRARGLTWGQIALQFQKDKNNIRRGVLRLISEKTT